VTVIIVYTYLILNDVVTRINITVLSLSKPMVDINARFFDNVEVKFILALQSFDNRLWNFYKINSAEDFYGEIVMVEVLSAGSVVFVDSVRDFLNVIFLNIGGFKPKRFKSLSIIKDCQHKPGCQNYKKSPHSCHIRRCRIGSRNNVVK
jgi:hypothetical protein